MMLDKVIEILEELKPGVDFRTENNLIKDHILESMQMVQLIAELNDEFDIEITPRDIVPENFRSAESICQLVDELMEED